MNIAGYHRALGRIMRELNITGPMPFEFDHTPPFNVLDEIALTTKSEPQKYTETNFVQAQKLRRGMVIVEHDARGKKTKHPVADAYRIGEYGHGHIVVSVSRQLWRYEPEALVEID